MPYGISKTMSDCEGWATVKQTDSGYETIGCHENKQDAIKQMIAVSLSEEMEPLGDVSARKKYKERALPDNYRPALADDVPEGRACGNCVFYDERNQDDSGTKAYCTQWDEYVDGAYYCNAWKGKEEELEMDSRAEVNLSAPSFMRASARRGLELHEEGYSGDGLKPQTVEDARKMASGQVTEEKWRKIAPWIARHIVDLDAVDGDEITPGLVAMLLWGGGSSKTSALRARNYAERIVERLEEQRAPAPKKDQIFGSKVNPKGSAEGKEGNIELSDSIENSLQTKADEHNARMSDESKPSWTRVRVGSLRSVWRRGAGAFSTSHRPNVTRQQWAMARVNAFLYLAEKGKPENQGYVQDNDLLHPEHPKYSGTRMIDNSFDNISDVMNTEELRTTQWVICDETESRRIAYSNLELRASEDGTKLVGYAAVFDSPSEPMPFTEYVRRGAFQKTLKDGADVRLLIDHEGIPLARTKSGTLMLEEDERGLRVEAMLDPMNPDAARVISAMRRGDMSQMSFAFRTIKDNWSSDRAVRELKEVQLFDVSVVTFPAYEETVAELRKRQTVDTIKESDTLALRKRQLQLVRLSK